MTKKTKAQKERAARAKKGWETRRMAKLQEAIKNGPTVQQGIANAGASSWRAAEVAAGQNTDYLTYQERALLPHVESLRQGKPEDAARRLLEQYTAHERTGEIRGVQKATLEANEQHQHRALCDFTAMVSFKEHVRGHEHVPLTVSAATAKAIANYLVRQGFTPAGVSNDARRASISDRIGERKIMPDEAANDAVARAS